MSDGATDIPHAAALLLAGRVVAFPTETVYGLGASALNPAAIAEVFRLKGRPPTNPLIVHVSGPDMARSVTRLWPDAADRLARRFWPGPLSIVLPKDPSIPASVTAGTDSIAVRCPDHPVALALLFHVGLPLVGPSANRSGALSPTLSEHVRAAFDPAEVHILEGGPCRTGIESTVLSLTGPQPVLLRPGAISPTDIAALLGRPVLIHSASHPSHAAAPSPGLSPRHYAPSTPARLFDPAQWPHILPTGGSAMVLSHLERPVAPPHLSVCLGDDPARYAALLYAALHDADRPPTTLILIERPPSPDSDPLWTAILDRLTRATAPA